MDPHKPNHMPPLMHTAGPQEGQLTWWPRQLLLPLRASLRLHVDGVEGCCRAAGAAAHTCELAEDAVRKLKGQLVDLERSHRLGPPEWRHDSPARQALSGSDAHGAIPWHPAGRQHTPASPANALSISHKAEMSFHPHINQRSRELMGDTRSAASPTPFLHRVENDLRGRKMRLKTKTENVCAQQRQTDPLSTQRRAERCAFAACWERREGGGEGGG